MRAVAIILLVALPAMLGCDVRTRTKRSIEPYALVPGTPTVESKTPAVLTDPTRETSNFNVNVARQCDVYQQVSSRKVDILWVVDSSGSMAAKQARLSANFSAFVNQLVQANPPIDFHIAVATTDVDDSNTRGKLRRWTLGGLNGDYISCQPANTPGRVSCNTGGDAATAIPAFNQLSAAGITGSSVERGLYSAYLVLTNPLNISTAAVEHFVRDDASLYIVFVSDEDDSSCNPLTRQTVCTADPGCRCAAEGALTGTGAWGSVAYFTRFFETYKGFGNQDSVTVAAIVAADGDAGVPSQFGDPSPHVGCCRSLNGAQCPTSGANDGGFEVAYHGARYAQTAAAAGGVIVSICDADFSGALSNLGYSASGLRREYRLTRGPDARAAMGIASGLQGFVTPPNAMSCQNDGNCPNNTFCRSNRCARKFDVAAQPVTTGAEYVKCDSAGLRNLVRFNGTSVPEALSTVEVCYDVLASFDNSCP